MNSTTLSAEQIANAVATAVVNAVTEALSGNVEAPAKPAKAKTTKAKGARKTKARKPASTTIEGKTCLVSANRKQFIADHEWAQDGSSVRQLATAVLVDGQPLVGNWAIGPNRTRLILGDAPAAKPAKKGKKAKKTQAVVADVKATDAAKPCRRANGTIAPKTEWDTRRKLADKGLTPAQVDAAVAVL